MWTVDVLYLGHNNISKSIPRWKEQNQSTKVSFPLGNLSWQEVAPPNRFIYIPLGGYHGSNNILFSLLFIFYTFINYYHFFWCFTHFIRYYHIFHIVHISYVTINILISKVKHLYFKTFQSCYQNILEAPFQFTLYQSYRFSHMIKKCIVIKHTLLNPWSVHWNF